jgi:hypothetical protein
MCSADASRQVAMALRMGHLFNSLCEAYQEALKETIFSKPIHGHDQKLLTTFRKSLEDEEAYSILMTTWKESPFVTEEALAMANMDRIFKNAPLTVYGLAAKISVTALDLAKTNSRIRAIAIAAEAYGLVERSGVKTNSRPLSATALLHQLILTIFEKQFGLIAEFNSAVMKQ